MVKKILLGLLVVVVLFIIVGFFLPAKLEISRSTIVNAPPEYAFEEVNALDSWPKWSYWNTLDTAMAITYGDKRSGTGASYSWQSGELGDGKATISESVPFTSINAELDFMENGIAKAWYSFEPEGEGTKVTMNFSSDAGYNPFGRWMGMLLIKPAIVESFDYGLNKLKELAEAKPKFTIPITIENTSPISYIGVSHTMSPQDMDAVTKQMEKMYTELYGALEKAKVEPAGAPFALFNSFSEESMDFVAALPVPAGAKLPSKYKLMQTPGGRVVKAIQNGDYNNLEQTHQQIDSFISFKKLQVNNAPWEVYVVSPTNEKDPAKYVTEVYYPVE
mgnify:CR=1 FL=1